MSGRLLCLGTAAGMQVAGAGSFHWAATRQRERHERAAAHTREVSVEEMGVEIVAASAGVVAGLVAEAGLEAGAVARKFLEN